MDNNRPMMNSGDISPSNVCKYTGKKVYFYPHKKKEYVFLGVVNSNYYPDFSREPQVGEIIGVFSRDIEKLFRYKGYEFMPMSFKAYDVIKFDRKVESVLFYHLLVDGAAISVEEQYCFFEKMESPRFNNLLFEQDLDDMINVASAGISEFIEEKCDVLSCKLDEKLDRLEKICDVKIADIEIAILTHNLYKRNTGISKPFSPCS